MFNVILGDQIPKAIGSLLKPSNRDVCEPFLILFLFIFQILLYLLKFTIIRHLPGAAPHFWIGDKTYNCFLLINNYFFMTDLMTFPALNKHPAETKFNCIQISPSVHAAAIIKGKTEKKL